MRIVLLQDDEALATRIVRWLADDGHLVRRCHDPKAAVAAVARGPCDLLLVDAEPPARDPDDLRNAAHRAGVRVVYVVGRAAAARAEGALAGSIDLYICKPLRRRELANRVRDTARPRPARTDALPDAFEPYMFDEAARRVTRDGSSVDLTRREFDLALYLFRNADRVLSRECLLENIWGPQRRNLNTRTVDTHISRLRRKLGLGANGWHLASVYQHGYRLESPPAPH